MSKLTEQLESALRQGVPLVGVKTADQVGTAEDIARAFDHRPLVQWDCVRGLVGINKKGVAAATAAVQKAGRKTITFVDAMLTAEHLESYAVLIAYNVQRQITSSEPLVVASSVQAIANLREPLKGTYRMLICMGPAITFPMELARDVWLLEDALPTGEVLAQVVRDLHEGAEPPLPLPAKAVIDGAVKAATGLSLFEAEQALAMSFTKEGVLHVPSVWERKHVQIRQVKGMSVYTGPERFSDIIGMDSVKAKLLRRIKGRRGLGVVVVMDESDKIWGNVEMDTTGVRSHQMRTFLTKMEDNHWGGICAVGVTGAGKSLLAKAVANEAGVPSIWLDFGAMQASLVGESEQNLAHAIAVIEAIGGGLAYFIATSNNATVMRPEMQRRFRDGFFFFDVMKPAERAACWKYYMKKYDLREQKIPKDAGWTGSEIRNVCDEAWDTGCTLLEAAQHVVPMAQSRVHEIEALRMYADGRFLSADMPGPYKYESALMEEQVKAVRKITTMPPPALDEQLAGLTKES